MKRKRTREQFRKARLALNGYSARLHEITDEHVDELHLIMNRYLYGIYDADEFMACIDRECQLLLDEIDDLQGKFNSKHLTIEVKHTII